MKGNRWFCLDEVWSVADGWVLQSPHPPGGPVWEAQGVSGLPLSRSDLLGVLEGSWGPPGCWTSLSSGREAPAVLSEGVFSSFSVLFEPFVFVILKP